MTSRRSLGAHLAWLVTLSTALAIAAFALVAAVVVYVDEVTEVEEAEDDEPDDSPLGEVLEDVGVAIAVATPIGLLVALAGARWSARRVTARLDALVARASRMSAESLDERLPVSARDDELDDLARALNELFARLHDGIAGLRRFAADASHELRTPLAVTINTLEVALRRPRDAAEWARVGNRTLDELRHLADLVEALLHEARAGAFDAAAEPLELDDAVAGTVDRWREAATAANVTLALEGSSGVAAQIDPRGLAIAVGNVIKNAITHSPRGGAVTVRIAATGDRGRVEIDDQGPGVPAPDRARVFAPFARGADADTTGVGLGLAIARRIVEAHGGTIAIADAPGGGARFVIELPALAGGG